MYAYPTRACHNMSYTYSSRSIQKRVGKKILYIASQPAYTVMRMLVCSYKCCNGKAGCGQQEDT